MRAVIGRGGAAIGVAAACVVLGLPAAAARAAPYTVDTCRTPSGAPASAEGWTALTSGPNVYAVVGCPTRPLIAGVEPTKSHPRGTGFGFRFSAPPFTRIVGYSLRRRATVAGSAGSWAYNYTAFHDLLDHSRSAERCWASSGCSGLGLDAPARASGVSLGAVLAYTDCSMGPPQDCPANVRAELEIAAARFTLDDARDPVLTSAPSGTLLADAAASSGTRTVSFGASDQGGGVYRAVLEVDGRPVVDRSVDRNGGACAVPFRRPVPCKGTAGGSLSWDTRTVPDGPHSVRLLVYDATNANVAVHGPVEVTVRNAAAAEACAPSSVQIAASLRGQARRTVAYGRRVRVSGRVTRSDGSPVGRAPVRLVAVQPSQQQIATASTGADGRFSTLVPRGPSRTLHAAVRVPGRLEPACSRSLTLKVRAGLRLSAKPGALRNGERVWLVGRLLGRPFPAGGKLIDLQARARSRWLTFRTVRSTGQGTFRVGYRFGRTFRATTYRFRARARVEAAYPYALGHSPTVRVRVRP